MQKKQNSRDRLCTKHPRYKAVRRPTADCPQCVDAYLRKRRPLIGWTTEEQWGDFLESWASTFQRIAGSGGQLPAAMCRLPRHPTKNETVVCEIVPLDVLPGVLAAIKQAKNEMKTQGNRATRESVSRVGEFFKEGILK